MNLKRHHITDWCSYLKRPLVSMKVIWSIYIYWTAIGEWGWMRERERCTVIFIGSCCAIMMSSHHHIDVAATTPASKNCCGFSERGCGNSNEKLNLRNRRNISVTESLRISPVCLVTSNKMQKFKIKVRETAFVCLLIQFGVGFLKTRRLKK